MVEKYGKAMEPNLIKIERDTSKDNSLNDDSSTKEYRTNVHSLKSIKNKELNAASYSPQSAVNGAPTPSPPSHTSPTTTNSHTLFQPHSSTQPNQNFGNFSLAANGFSTTGSRHLHIVRRFLTTLQQFARDISADVGENVRNLILNLLNGSVSLEEFHNCLQEVTHFPLRTFVLPFLKSHLPFLIRELQVQAKRSGMTLAQHISAQESSILDSAMGDATDFFSSEVMTKKRKHENAFFENLDILTSSVTSISTAVTNGVTNNVGDVPNGGNLSPPARKRSPLFSPSYPTLGVSPELNLGSKDIRAVIGGPDNEWKNIHVMLTCILSMVEKTRRALTILQQREEREIPSSSGGGMSRSSSEGRSRSEYDAEVKRHASELVAHALKTTDERVAEVKRKAEEAVMEVRKTAIAEIQKAVANAELKTQEMVTAERCRFEGLLREIISRKEKSEEKKPDGQQSCWSCGKKAHDTCSGCNIAKYCSPICQHKDWDHHHKICSPQLAQKTSTASKINCKLQKTPDTQLVE